MKMELNMDCLLRHASNCCRGDAVGRVIPQQHRRMLGGFLNSKT